MVRARLALLALTLGLVSGCGLSLGYRSVGVQDECACQNEAYGAVEGSMTGMEGPILMQPDGGFVPPTPTGPPPRIVPVPQANPVPYTPTGLRRLFSRDP